MSANSSTPASSMASHSGIDAPNILLRPSSHRPTRQSMQTFGGGGGGGEGAMNLKDMEELGCLFVALGAPPPQKLLSRSRQARAGG